MSLSSGPSFGLGRRLARAMRGKMLKASAKFLFDMYGYELLPKLSDSLYKSLEKKGIYRK